jgi:hypothetical protein
MAAPPRLGRIAMDGDGTVYMATFQGLLRDDGTGCGWESVPEFAGQWVTDVSVHPADPNTMFAATSTGGVDIASSVHRRDPDGTWREIATHPEVLIGRLFVIERASGELRMYERAVHGMFGTPPEVRPRYVMRVSDDEGATWEEYEFGDTPGQIEIEAVDPTDADRVVVSLRSDVPEGATRKMAIDRVLVSNDRGETFSDYAEVTRFGGIDFASDGRVWIGDRGDPFDPKAPLGLWFAMSLGEAPRRVNDRFAVHCVDYRSDADDLFVCQAYEAGTLGADGSGYARSFAFEDVKEFVSCGSESIAPVCAEYLLGGWCGASHFPQAPLCCIYPHRQGADAGACASSTPDPGGIADAGRREGGSAGDAGRGPGSDAPDGCGCRAAGTERRGQGAAMWGLGLLALRVARRARRR